MNKDNYKVIKNDSPSEGSGLVEGDVTLALDYVFNRRPLTSFEEKRAKIADEKFDALLDKVAETPLY